MWVDTQMLARSVGPADVHWIPTNKQKDKEEPQILNLPSTDITAL